MKTRGLLTGILALGGIFSFGAVTARPAEPHPGAGHGPFVPLCTGIHLTAAYLAPTTPGGPISFHFVLQNDTAHTIKLQQPAPTSAHWYARVGQKWLWRASAGAGGSLADGLNEKGRLFASQPHTAPANPSFLAVPPHRSQEWIASEQDNPALAYKPGCALCNYPGEREYRVIFAYAYLPAPGQKEAGLLSCGLRSLPVDMPPRR